MPSSAFSHHHVLHSFPTRRSSDLSYFGLDQPLPLQYWNWLTSLLRGDAGYSIRTGRPVFLEIAQRLPATLELALAATAIALAVGLRSEEHTSELQSLTNLVCRLLLSLTTTSYTLSLHDALPISRTSGLTSRCRFNTGTGSHRCCGATPAIPFGPAGRSSSRSRSDCLPRSSSRSRRRLSR